MVSSSTMLMTRLTPNCTTPPKVGRPQISPVICMMPRKAALLAVIAMMMPAHMRAVDSFVTT